MVGCKQQILNSIASNSCCSHAFLSVLIDFCGAVDLTHKQIYISANDEICEKAAKIILNFYPNTIINSWKDFLLITGDIQLMLNDCNIAELDGDEGEHPKPNYSLFVSECDRLTLLKTTFLICGNFNYQLDSNQNSKGYHLEFFVRPENELLVDSLLGEFHFEFKAKPRQNGIRFYTKHSDVICDFLVRVGASYTALDVQNSLAIREVRNSANRQNNCFESNLDKTIAASAEQMKAINYFIDNNNLDMLDENLKEIALLRYANPYLPLSELKQALGKDISRAGIKYRLDKIIDIYKKHKGENQ